MIVEIYIRVPVLILNLNKPLPDKFLAILDNLDPIFLTPYYGDAVCFLVKNHVLLISHLKTTTHIHLSLLNTSIDQVHFMHPDLSLVFTFDGLHSEGGVDFRSKSSGPSPSFPLALSASDPRGPHHVITSSTSDMTAGASAKVTINDALGTACLTSLSRC